MNFSGFISSDLTNTCALCTMEVGSDGVGCDRCLDWYHPKCTGLRAQALQCIKQDGGQGITFNCSSCRFSQPYSPDTVNRHNTPVSQESVNQLFEMIRSLTITVAAQQSQYSSLADTVKGLTEKNNNQPSRMNDSDLYVKFFEFEDRKKRKDSIVIRGIQADNNSQFSGTFEQVAEKIIGDKVTPDTVHCIDRDRNIFRADIRDRNKRVALLQGAKKLKNDDQFKNVYINKDLTYQQRQEAKERREAARNRRPHRNPNQEPGINFTGGNRQALGSQSNNSTTSQGPPADGQGAGTRSQLASRAAGSSQGATSSSQGF